MKKNILVFGATGQQGFSVSNQLIEAGMHMHAFTRSATSAKALALKELGADIFEGQLDNKADLQRAMDGVYGLFLVLPPCWEPTPETDEKEWETGKLIIDLAKEANVKHIIYSSVMGSELQEPFRPLFKYTIEKYLQASGINYTIFKPAIFFENFYMPQYGLSQRLIYNPLPAEMQLPFISVEDIGSFARLALAFPDMYAEKIFNIAGELIKADELAALFSETLGQQIMPVQVPPAVIRSQNELLGKFMEVLHQADYPVISIDELKQMNPNLMDTREWLRQYGFDRLKEIVKHEQINLGNNS